MFSIDKGDCRNDNVLSVYTMREVIVRGYRAFSILSFNRSFGFNLHLCPGVLVCKFTMSRLGKVSDKGDEIIQR